MAYLSIFRNIFLSQELSTAHKRKEAISQSAEAALLRPPESQATLSAPCEPQGKGATVTVTSLSCLKSTSLMALRITSQKPISNTHTHTMLLLPGMFFTAPFLIRLPLIPVDRWMEMMLLHRKDQGGQHYITHGFLHLFFPRHTQRQECKAEPEKLQLGGGHRQ